jgi:hypothetical protein
LRPDAGPDASFRDRTVRLQLFGTLAVLCGGVCVVLGLLHLLLILVGGEESLELDPASLVMSALTYGLIGAILIWAGVGSLRRRRWVRSLMLILGWTWLIAGVLGTLVVVVMLDDLLMLAFADLELPPPAYATTIKVVLVLLTAGTGVALPLAFIWAYREPDVLKTCAAADPVPDWTARCPLPVLGLSFGLAAVAILCLPLAVRPAVPCFGRLVTGWAGGLLLVLGGAVAALLARSTFKLSVAGWWGTTLLLILVGVSVAVTFLRVDAAEYYRALGYPEQQLEVLGRSVVSSRWVTVGGTAALTLLSLVYMAAIRTHFDGDSRGAGA